MAWIIDATCPHCGQETEWSSQELFKTKKEAEFAAKDFEDDDVQIIKVKASDYEYLKD